MFVKGSIDAWRFFQSERSGCSGQTHTMFIDAHGHCGFWDAGEVIFPRSRLMLPILQAYELFLRVEGSPLHAKRTCVAAQDAC